MQEDIINIVKNHDRRISFGNNPIQSERQDKAEITLTHQTNMINITYNEEFPIQEKEFWLQGEEEEDNDDDSSPGQKHNEIQKAGNNEVISHSNKKNKNNQDDELSEKMQLPLIILKNNTKNNKAQNKNLILSTQANMSQYATNNLLSSPSLKPQFEYQFATSIDDTKTPQNNKISRKKYQNQSGFALRELAEDEIDLSPIGGQGNMKSPMNDLQSPNMSRDLTQDYNLLKMQKKQMKIDDRYSQQQFEWQQPQDQGEQQISTGKNAEQNALKPKQTGKLVSNNQYPSFNYCSEADNQDQQSIQLNNQITAHNFDQEYEEPYSYHQHNIASNPNILQHDSRVPTDFDENEEDPKKHTIIATSNKYLNQNMNKETLEKGIGRLLFQQQQYNQSQKNVSSNNNNQAVKNIQNSNLLAPPAQHVNTQSKSQILSSPSLNQEIIRTQIDNDENGRTITLEVDHQSIEQFNQFDHLEKITKNHSKKQNDEIKINLNKHLETTEALSDNQQQGSSDNIKLTPTRKSEKHESPNKKINDINIKKGYQQQNSHSEENLFGDEDFGEFQEEKFHEQEQIKLQDNQSDQKEDDQYEDDEFDDFEDSNQQQPSQNHQNDEKKKQIVNEQQKTFQNQEIQEQSKIINQNKQQDDPNLNILNILDCHPTYINNQFKSIAAALQDQAYSNFDYYLNFQAKDVNKPRNYNEKQFLEYEKKFNQYMAKVFKEPGLQAFSLQNENVIGSNKRIHQIEDINGLNDEIRLEYIGISEELTKFWEKSKQKSNLLEFCGVDDEESAIKQDQVYYQIQEKKLNHIMNNQTVIKSKKQ